MAIVFLHYSYVYTIVQIPVCIPEGILIRIFPWAGRIFSFVQQLPNGGHSLDMYRIEYVDWVAPLRLTTK